MTKLREQMIQDMVLRGLAPSTQRSYLEAVTKFARYYNRAPDLISNEELKAYLLYLHLQEKRATSTCNVAAAALRIELVELSRVAWGVVLGVSKRVGGLRESGKQRTTSVGVDAGRV